MSKQTIYIGISCVGATTLPSPKGLISLAVAVGREKLSLNFSRPGGGQWSPSKSWERYPEEWATLLTNQIPQSEAIAKYLQWLALFPGRHIAVGSPLDFYWLFSTLMEETGRCSFGSNGFLDSRTIRAIQLRNYSLVGASFAEGRIPSEIAVYRAGLGEMVRDGDIRLPAPKKTPPQQPTFQQLDNIFAPTHIDEAIQRIQQAPPRRIGGGIFAPPNPAPPPRHQRLGANYEVEEPF